MGARAGCIGEKGDGIGGQTRTGHGQVNTCIYRREMNRMSVVNGKLSKSKLRPGSARARRARARYLQHTTNMGVGKMK